MTIRNLKYLLICLLIQAAYAKETKAKQNDTFVATKEWKTIKPGQKVPSGLHYRINMQTGEKEAKLIDEEENPLTGGEKSSLSVVKDDELGNKSKNASLEEALKNIPADIYEYSQEEMDQIKSQFRTYDEIKAQLKDVNINVKTDSEIMSKLIEEYEEVAKEILDDTKVLTVDRILEDLEFLVHQIDNALAFIDKNGIEKIIIPNLNRTNSGIKIKCLQLLGSITQNNPKAQIKCFEKNIGENLVRFLSKTKVDAEISACFFAFSSLLRQFPLAQKEILTKSVFTVLFDIWTKEIHLRVKVKVLNFMIDLIIEGMDAKKDFEKGVKVERFHQYEAVNLEESLKDFGFCTNVEQLVIQNKLLWVSNPELTERMVGSLLLTTNICPQWSDKPDLRHVLLVIKHRYTAMVEDEPNEHLQTIISNVVRLYDVLFEQVVEKYKDEL